MFKIIFLEIQKTCYLVVVDYMLGTSGAKLLNLANRIAIKLN
jgi:hypothetical protein